MTKSQYKRLLKILALPLLIAGAIFSAIIGQDASYVTIICRSADDCITTDGLGERFDTIVREQEGDLFEINLTEYEDNEFPYAIISGSPVVIPNAQILDVSTYAGTSEAPGSPFDELKSATGERITLVMGINSGENDLRLLNPLSCNGLSLIHTPSYYEAELCGVPDGVVKVRFLTDEKSADALQVMKSNIEEEISDARTSLILHYVFGIPSFLIGFLLLSGLVWMIGRAAAYVRHG